MTRPNTFARTASALSIASLLGIASLSGCGTEPDFDLNALEIADEGSKADTLGTQDNGDFSWTRAVPGYLQCIKPPCPSTKLYGVNSGATRFVYRFDWRAMKLSSTEVADVESKSGTMLMYGRYATGRAFGENVLIYQVTRANVPATDRAVDKFDTDKFYATKAGPDCPSNPQCTQLTASLLNQRGQNPENWTSLDLTRLELTQAAEKTVLGELKNGRDYVSIIGVNGGVARASQVFRPYKSAPLQ